MTFDRGGANQLSELSRALLCCESPLNIADLACCCARVAVRGHLAIVREPYLSRIISGHKTIESRLSKKRMPPFGLITKGDVVIFKEVAGPIRAIASVSRIETFGPLSPGGAAQIMEMHRAKLALDAAFREHKEEATFATLMFLEHVLEVGPLMVQKQDRRAWVVLKNLPVRLI